MENRVQDRIIQEDEIDLRELFKTIWKRKYFVIGFTFVISFISIVYALMKTPIYEVKAVVEIGSFKDDKSTEKLLDDSIKLSQELSILFIDILKNEENREAWIEKVETLKKQKSFIELVSQGLDNEKATNELKKVIKYIKDKHFKVIDEIINYKKLELTNLVRKIQFINDNKLVNINEDINYLKNTQLPSLEKKIITIEKKIEDIKSQIKTINLNIIKTKNSNASLTALDVMEKRSLEASLSNLSLQIIDLNDSKITLEEKTLPRLLRDKERLIDTELVQLLEEKNLLEKSLLPHNYKNSAIVGKIIVNDYAVKPKKKLIVVVAFVTGFILAIFLVFVIEFIRNEKNEKKIQSSN